VVDLDIKILWKGHYVAKIDPELCNGCASCIHRCQFRALSFNPSRNKAYIDQFQCFGCGLCATECDQEAITMVERASLPALANVW
jgi:MinD superfamily P-loop ATPase